MRVVSVTLKISPGRISEFLPLIQQNARASRETEPGCRRFDVCISDTLPDTVYLYEVYDDDAAFEAHQKTPHYAAFGTAGGPMIAEKHLTLWTIANE